MIHPDTIYIQIINAISHVQMVFMEIHLQNNVKVAILTAKNVMGLIIQIVLNVKQQLQNIIILMILCAMVLAQLEWYMILQVLFL